MRDIKPITLPTPHGPYPVGLWHTALPFEGDTLSLTVFYPADGEGEPAPYAFPQVLEPLGLPEVTTACRLNAEAATGTFPLVLFSHGYLTYEMCCTVLCADLASHGYVAAAIGHAGEALIRLPGGTVVPKGQAYVDYVYEPQSLKAAEGILDAVAAAPPDDAGLLARLAGDFHAIHDGNLNDRAAVWDAHTVAAADFMEALSADPGSRLFGRLDTGRGIGLTGHSFGGATAANCCMKYSRFSCGINIDGAQLGDSFGRDIGKPFMSISGDDGGGILLDMFMRNTADAYQAVIAGVGHMGFTDRGILGRLSGRDFPDVGGKNPLEVRALLLALHRAFFDRYLLGGTVPVSAPEDLDVTLKTRLRREDDCHA